MKCLTAYATLIVENVTIVNSSFAFAYILKWNINFSKKMWSSLYDGINFPANTP